MLPINSVMGETGSGKSTVRSLPSSQPFFWVGGGLPRKLIMPPLFMIYSSLTSSVGPTSTLAVDYDLAQALYYLPMLSV
jgi:hypothetical protein